MSSRDIWSSAKKTIGRTYRDKYGAKMRMVKMRKSPEGTVLLQIQHTTPPNWNEYPNHEWKSTMRAETILARLKSEGWKEIEVKLGRPRKLKAAGLEHNLT